MFKLTKAKTVREYLDSVPPEQKELVFFLHKFIQKTVPKLKAHFASNMIGYGSHPYLNYKKELVDWPIIAMAYRKQGISLYICALKNGKYIAEIYKNELGKVKVGKSCINITRLDNINLPALKKVLLEAEKSPGLVDDRKK